MDIDSHFHTFIEKISLETTDVGSQITKWKECLEKRKLIEFVRRSGSTRSSVSSKSKSYVDW